MKKRMHQHSLDAFEQIEDERSERADKIYQLLLESGCELTDRQIMTALGFSDPNAVRPRVTELVDNRWLIETREVECRVTGKKVRCTRALTSDQRAALLARQRARWESQQQRRTPVQQLSLSFA